MGRAAPREASIWKSLLFQFPAYSLGEAIECDQSTWARATHIEDLEEGPGCGSITAPAFAIIWDVNEYIEVQVNKTQGNKSFFFKEFLGFLSVILLFCNWTRKIRT